MSSYNLRVYTYVNGQQFRFYKKAIGLEKEKEEKEKEEKEKEEKEKEEKDSHSDIVSHNRSKQKLYELARSNQWDWFITLTFNQKLVDSSDYQLICILLKNWLGNMRKRCCNNLKYLIVPELHKDGVHYHFHGLISNADGLQFHESGIVQKGKMVYNMDKWTYGFSTATKIEDYNKVCSYIAKYITKELCATTKGKKRYWASRNLDKPLVENYAMTSEELEEYKDMILKNASYVKTQKCEVIGQSVTYIEVPI